MYRLIAQFNRPRTVRHIPELIDAVRTAQLLSESQQVYRPSTLPSGGKARLYGHPRWVKIIAPDGSEVARFINGRKEVMNDGRIAADR